MDGGLSFHCTAPPGQWINDPNALFYVEGRFRLLMQHSPEPEPGPVGWAAASSEDLLGWRWDGVAIPPDARGYAYSGCVVEGDAYLTRHDPMTTVQTQHRRAGIVGDDGPAIGPVGRNRRDPFVFWNPPTGDWRMLAAAPCDWTDWRADPPSVLEVWRLPDRTTWSPAGVIGPWSPPGVMWEVPVLLRLDGADVLILSIVDRRQDIADCSVRYWTGRFAETFEREGDCPEDGWPLDLGPDFYAAIVNSEQGWPLPERHLVAWASNWRFARQLRSGGGPITLPRTLSLQDGRIVQRWPPNADPLIAWQDAAPTAFVLSVTRGSATLKVSVDRTGSAEVEWHGGNGERWNRHHPAGTLRPASPRQLTLFRDGPLCELFIQPDGVTVTALLQGEGEAQIEFKGVAPPP